MNSQFSDIFKSQERLFKSFVMKDYLQFKNDYKTKSGFSCFDINSREYEIQNYFEKRIEHYMRSTIINGVIKALLENKGVQVHEPLISSGAEGDNTFFDNNEYEALFGYEFIAEYVDTTVIYRYTDIPSDMASSLLNGSANTMEIINWDTLVNPKTKKITSLPEGKEIRYISVCDFFKERIGIDEYQDFISSIIGVIIEYQEFIGVKSTPKLSPFSIGQFRFEIENYFKDYIQEIEKNIKLDQKIAKMGIPDTHGIDYGYIVIDDDNKEKYSETAESSKKLLCNTHILEEFADKKMYKYLIGKSDFAKSLITSEYLYKQYDCDDCFDYTSIVSGYLKSIEQLLFTIVHFSKNKGYKIKNNGKKNKKGKYPPSTKEGKVYKIEFNDDNDGCFDTTIGSLIHFLDDNKSDLLIVEEEYKSTIIKCLDCYRIECRNDSFHLDNNCSWSKVEQIKGNTYLLYILLLTCLKLGDTEHQTQTILQLITDDRLERIYYIITSGKKGIFEFVFEPEVGSLIPIKAKHVPKESNYPSYNSVGQLQSAHLTFESIPNGEKMIITKNNLPQEIYFIEEGYDKIKIE